MVGVFHVFQWPFYSNLDSDSYRLFYIEVSGLTIQVLFNHNLIVLKGAITIFVGLQALSVFFSQISEVY